MAEDFKIQVSLKNPHGDLLNVRGESPVEVQAALDQLVNTGIGRAFPRVIESASQGGSAPAPAPAAPAAGSVPAPAAPAPRQVEWAEGKKPRGGTFKYRPSHNLPTETFKQAVAAKINEAGFDATQFVVFDERIGERGLESGGASYSPASVKPTKASPLYNAMTEGRSTKGAFFVDFTQNGGIKVSATNALNEALAATAAPAAPSAPSEDVPF